MGRVHVSSHRARKSTYKMPGGKSGARQKSRHVKAKKQKKRFMRAKDPIQAVFMWGIHHSVSKGCIII